MSPRIDDTFAEAFPMVGTRLIFTAATRELARIAAQEFCGNASSVIGCDTEAAIECEIAVEASPDGRPGIAVLAFAFSRKDLEKAVAARVGQNVLTCPTTACYAGLDSPVEKQIKLGAQLRFFGDGHQISKKLGDRRLWRVPVMDGEFLIDDITGTQKGVGGGNLIVTGREPADCLADVQAAVNEIRKLPDIILPFPAGIVRSGSKVGSKYPQLRASTNDSWCPSLRHLNAATNDHASESETTVQSDRVGEAEASSGTAAGPAPLGLDENVVYEIVIDGLSEESVAKAMRTGIRVLSQSDSILRISAGNYGGKLGPFHFKLRDLLSV
ncbi:MAG: formylmethanofuran--tetrahydromethanopterin N-formyltransferase [Aureliella sp.]